MKQIKWTAWHLLLLTLGLFSGVMAAGLSCAMISLLDGMEDSLVRYAITHGFGVMFGSGLSTAIAIDGSKTKTFASHPLFSVWMMIGFGAFFTLIMPVPGSGPERTRFFYLLAPMVILTGILASGMALAERRGWKY